MSKGFSQTTVLGNLTADPELKKTSTGKDVISFTLAVNRGDQADFIDVVAWDKAAEIISKYCSRGKQLLVSGPIQQRTWEDKSTGAKRSKLEVLVREFTLLGSTDKDERTKDVAPTEIDDSPINLSDIPF